MPSLGSVGGTVPRPYEIAFDYFIYFIINILRVAVKSPAVKV